jgi:2-keto-3-deoxy-L-rhamnonate aldolase RhmA
VVIPSPEAIQQAVEDGYTFLGVGMDTVFLREGANRALNLARK